MTALVLRLGVVWFVLARLPKGWFFRTQGELGFLTQSLLAGHGLSSPFGGSTGPTAFLAPGYPAIIAAVFAVLGSFTTASAIAVMLLQTFFGVLTVFLIMQIANDELGAETANLAGAFWAIGIPFLWLPAVFWDTSLSTLLFVGMVGLALRCPREPGTRIWALMGIYGGVVLLVNPTLSLTMLGLLGWALYYTNWPAVRAQPSALRGPILGTALFLLVFAPWPIRNARVMHAFIPLRSNLGFELWKGNLPGATPMDDPALYPASNNREYSDYSSKGEVAYMHDKLVFAVRDILSHPRAFIHLTIDRFVYFWTGTGSPDRVPFLTWHESLLTVLGLLGLRELFRQRAGGLAMAFLIPLVLFPLPCYITHAEIRFRLIVDPVITILAAYVITRWIAAYNRRHSIAVAAT